MKVVLPAKPIDQYRLDWWWISVSDVWYSIHKMHAIYHINTPWNKYSPNEKGEVDLVDDWMIHKDGHLVGRWCGWNTAINIKTYWESCFLTGKEAEEESMKRLYKYLDAEKKKAAYIEQMIAEISCSLRG